MFYSRPGVTRNLNGAYFRPLRRGEDAGIVCFGVNAGRTMVAVRAEIFLCVVGVNDKMNTDERVDSKI